MQQFDWFLNASKWQRLVSDICKLVEGMHYNYPVYLSFIELLITWLNFMGVTLLYHRNKINIMRIFVCKSFILHDNQSKLH